MSDIQSKDILSEKALEIILNFKPSDKHEKAVVTEILRLKEDIKKTIALSSKTEQEIFDLRFYQNLSDEKISERLGKSRDEVNKTLLHCVRSVKEKLGKESSSFDNVQKIINISNIKQELKNQTVIEQPKSIVNKTIPKATTTTVQKPSFFAVVFSLAFYAALIVGGYFIVQKFFFHSSSPKDQNSVEVRNVVVKNKVENNIDSNAVRISGSSSLFSLARRWENSFNVNYPKYHINLISSDSDKGINGLLRGKFDIANSSRPVTFADRKKASESGLELLENRVALDALVIVVNKKNPIEEISLDELEKIFTNEIKNWKEAGLSDFNVKLAPVIREKGSGTNDFVINRILEGNDFPSLIPRKTKNADLIEYVSANEGAIGFVNSTAFSWENKNIKYLKVKNYDNSVGISPYEDKKLDENSIRYGDYPLAHYLYLITLSDAPKQVQEFVSWVLSDDGQKVVAYSGLIPVIKSEE